MGLLALCDIPVTYIIATYPMFSRYLKPLQSPCSDYQGLCVCVYLGCATYRLCGFSQESFPLCASVSLPMKWEG